MLSALTTKKKKKERKPQKEEGMKKKNGRRHRSNVFNEATMSDFHLSPLGHTDQWHCYFFSHI